ncbi:MAG: glycosyltransferase family 8 protein [Treponema sp.]|nr:glycosyltransferase family 8 protein [Treponema sp.]
MPNYYKFKQVIPICFASDDNYIPLLSVAIVSLLENANPKNFYKIYILTTKLKQENIDKIQKLQTPNSKIEFISLAKEMDKIQSMFSLRDYYSKETYYRIFIPNVFPEYSKIVYLDCDITVLGDISKFYNTEIHGYYVGAVEEEVMQTYEVFGNYVEKVCGINRNKYFNAGVLLINCNRWRLKMIAERFVDLLNKVNFRVVQDEDYLNVLCKNNVKWVDLGWNKTSYENKKFDPMDLNLIHWKMNWRPWKYKDVLYEEHFWKYAKKSGFYDDLVKMRDSRTDEDKAKDVKMFENLSKMADDDAASPSRYAETIGKTNTTRKIKDKILMFIKFRKLINLRVFRRKL